MAVGEASGGAVVCPGTRDQAVSTDEVARRFFAAAGLLPDVLRVAVALTTGGGRELAFTASDRDPDDGDAAWCRIDGLADVPLAQAVRTGEPVEVTSVVELQRRFPQLRARQVAMGTRALAAYPLLEDGAVLGGVLVSYGAPQSFGAGQRDQLRTLAEGAARALGAVRRRPRTGSRDADPLPSVPGVALAAHHGLPANGCRQGWVDAVPRPDGTLSLAAGNGTPTGANATPDPRAATRALLDPQRGWLHVVSDGAGPVLVTGAGGADRLGAGCRRQLPGGSLVVLHGGPPRVAPRTSWPGEGAGWHPLEACLRVAARCGAEPVSVLAAAVGEAPGTRRWHAELPADVSAPRRSRGLLHELLATAGAADLLDAALVCVSELATNAVIHTATPARLDIQLDPRRLLVLLTDAATTGSHPEDARRPPLPAAVGNGPSAAPGPGTGEDAGEDVGGRGLLLVSALADRWGWRTGARGTTVWFELDR